MLVPLFFFGVLPFVLTADLVPVFIWDSARDGSGKYTNVPVLSKVGKGEFRGILQEKLKANPVVLVFAEENLSIEDLSWQDEAGHGTFPHLRNLSRSGEADLLYIPFVDSPLEVLRHVFPATHPNWNEASVGPEGIPILNEDTPDSNYLRVNLKDAKDNDDRPELLRRHDSIISDIYKKARQKHNRVVAIYTAHHSSWHVEDGVRSRRARQLAEEKGNEEGKEQGDATEKPEEVLGETQEGKKDLKPETSEENQDSKMEEKEEKMKEENEGMAEGEENSKDKSREYDLGPSAFPGMVPGLLDDNYPQFMTAPILSGLLVTSLLLIILSVAISALMDIKPMLRFDDPKGKGLVVTVSE